MSASHSPLDNTQQTAFNNAIELFGSANINQEELTALWKAALPDYAEQCREFLQTQLEKFKRDFLGVEGVVFPVHPDGPEIVAPWTVKDLNVYYKSRNDKPAIAKVLEKRRVLTVSENPFTEYDDFQLIRDAGSEAAAKRAALQMHLNQLHVISYSIFAIDEHTHPQRIYFLTILRILDYFRSLLPLEEENRFYSAATISRIDAITEHVALFYLDVIKEFQVDEEKEMLKDMLDTFNHFDHEISPWLALYFRSTVLLENDPENKLIHEFLKFHSLRHPETALGLITKLQGGNIADLYVELLGAERNLWRSLSSKTFADKLQFLSKYIYYPKLSDWVAMNLCRELVKESSVYGYDPEFSNIVCRFIERIKIEEFYLPKTSDYLRILRRDMTMNEDAKKIILAECPAIYLSLTCDTEAELQSAAMSINDFPPSARLFYARIAVSQPSIIISAATDKELFAAESLDDAESEVKEEKIPDSNLRTFDHLKNISYVIDKDYLEAIFSDYRYHANHIDYLSSDSVAELKVSVEDFPYVALCLHYSQRYVSPDVVKLWEAFLDNCNICEDDFFAFPNNCELFSHLQSQKQELLDPQKIRQHPQRYRRLALALDIFRTAQGRIFDVFSIFNSSRSAIRFTPSPSTAWAEEFYADIIRVVAYTYSAGNSSMDFANVVKFMDVPLDNRIMINPETLSAQITKYHMEYYNDHLELNPNHINKLIFSFMKLFKSREPLPQWEIDKIKAFPLHQLHPLCIGWADLSFLTEYHALGNFESVSRKMDFSSMTLSQSTQNSILSMAGNVFSNLMRSLSSSSPVSALFQNVEDPAPYLIFQLNYNSAYCKSRATQGLPLEAVEQELVAYQSKPADLIYGEQQVQSFIKIYNALRVAQSGPTTNWVKEVNLENLPQAQALAMIKYHANKPGSRTQKAWELVNSNGSQEIAGNFDLLKAIYAYGFRHSLFKKSSFLGENFYRTSTLEQNLQELQPFMLSAYIDEESDTRMGKIVRALSR